MLVKLALRNVRRSVRDYAVYFVTLVFGVAVFYAFNSVKGQAILLDLETSASEAMFDATGAVMGMFSVLVACVLGFLVAYSNRFLIRRRKREFGTYLLLGMRPGQVSAIVLAETALVGLGALAVGLAAGVALSQGLSFATAGLFSIPMRQYQFVFSPEAFWLTLACFALIFLVVAVLNTGSVRRCELADLLQAGRRSERLLAGGLGVRAAGFVVSVALLAAAYATLISHGAVSLDGWFWLSTGLMLAGTFLFFWSLAGFVLAVIQRTRGMYLKGLVPFTMRQIASKVNTAFLSLSVVCVMLFFSFSVFSVGVGFADVFSRSVEESTPFDATVGANVYLGTQDPDTAEEFRAEGESFDWDMAARFDEAVPGWAEGFVDGYTQVNFYQPAADSPMGHTTTYGELMERLGSEAGGGVIGGSLLDQTVRIIGEGDFNAVREMIGRDTVSVPEGGYLVNNAFEATDAFARAMAAEGVRVEVAGQALTASGELMEQPLQTAMLSFDGLEIVVPDEVVERLRAAGEAPVSCSLNLRYSVDRAQGDERLYRVLEEVAAPSVQETSLGFRHASIAWPVTQTYLASEVVEQSAGARMLISYLALYLGFVFLIATAALLAVQQLSETSDSLPRYRLLAEIGCDRRMVLGSLRIQTLVYFLAPLALAACHAACAVGVVSAETFSLLGVSVEGPILLTLVLTAVVYGGYLAVTYLACCGIVRSSLGRRLLG